MVDMSSISGVAFKAITTPLIWIVIVFILGLLTLGMLWYRKNKKLQYPTVVVTNLGQRKVGLELTKSGWFKKKSIIFGLWDWKGEQVLKVKDGRRIQQGGAEDFHEFNGRRALIVKRKSDDPKILVPLRTLVVSNNDLLAEIAPADYRDASNEILRSAESEMKEKWKQILDYIVIGGIIVFALISIIVITQMVQKSQKEVGSLIREVATKCECSGLSAKASTYAP